MENTKPKICQVCGSVHFRSLGGGKWKCTACDTVHECETAAASEELKYISLYESAEQELRMTPPRFDDAEDKFSDLIRQYPEKSAGYWGYVRAKFGIKYEDDFDGKAVASCYKSSYEDFRNDRYFLKAVELAENEDIKNSYIREADKIAAICKEWREVASRYNYDIFISFKATEETDGRTVNTSDKMRMTELYTLLTSDGYNVFFSPISLHAHGIVGAKSEPYIFNALDKSKVLIVYGSQADYFESTWIKNEWSRYLRAMSRNEKPQNSLLVLYEGFDIKDLPSKLREKQALDFSRIKAYVELKKAIKDILKSESKSGSHIERIRIESGKTGKRAESVGETIQTVPIGRKYNAKSANEVHRTEVSSYVRELADSVSAYTVDEEDYLSTALSCLENSMYSEALNFASDCLKINPENGKAWLIKLCVNLKSVSLWRYVVESGTLIPKITSSYDIINLKNSIKYSANRSEAERLISFACREIRVSFNTNLKGLHSIYDLYSVISDYNSPEVTEVGKFLAENATELYKRNPEQGKAILAKLLYRTTEYSEYVKLLEQLSDNFLENGTYSLAKEFNDKLLESDENNAIGVFNKILLDAFVKSKSDYVKNVVNVNYAYIDSKLQTVNIDCAERIVSMLYDVEKRYISSGDIAKAKQLYLFVARYKSKDRNNFLQYMMSKIDDIAIKDMDFYESILSGFDEKDVDWHIETRMATAMHCVTVGAWDVASQICQRVLEIENGNYKALKTLMLCNIRYSSDLTDIDFTRFKQKQLDNLLSYCPDSESQYNEVTELCNICRNYIEKENNKKVQIKNCLTVYDLLLRYLSESTGAVYIEAGKMAKICLKIGDFENAEKYFRIYSNYDANHNHYAKWGILLAKLRCKNENEFTYCKNFVQDMPEYKEVLITCRGDKEAFQYYKKYVDKNLENIASHAKMPSVAEALENLYKNSHKNGSSTSANVKTKKQAPKVITIEEGKAIAKKKADNAITTLSVLATLAFIAGIVLAVLTYHTKYMKFAIIAPAFSVLLFFSAIIVKIANVIYIKVKYRTRLQKGGRYEEDDI